VIGETRSRDIGFDVIADNVQVGERLPLQARDDVETATSCNQPGDSCCAALQSAPLAPGSECLFLSIEKGLLVIQNETWYSPGLNFHLTLHSRALVALADGQPGTLGSARFPECRTPIMGPWQTRAVSQNREAHCQDIITPPWEPVKDQISRSGTEAAGLGGHIQGLTPRFACPGHLVMRS